MRLSHGESDAGVSMSPLNAPRRGWEPRVNGSDTARVGTIDYFSQSLPHSPVGLVEIETASCLPELDSKSLTSPSESYRSL